MASPEQDTKSLCPRCKTNPRAGKSETNPWCLECRAEHQKKYELGRLQTAELRGYAAGCAAMKDYLMKFFCQFPNVVFSGAEISAKIAATGSHMPEN